MPAMRPAEKVLAVRDLDGNEATSATVTYNVTVTNTGNVALDLKVTVAVVFATGFFHRVITSLFSLAPGAEVNKEIDVDVRSTDPVGDFTAEAVLHDPLDPNIVYDSVLPEKIGEITPPDGIGPTASFTWEQERDTIRVNFDASGSTPGDAPIAIYVWDWGDGETSAFLTDPNTFHVFPFVDDVYTVTLWVIALDGKSDRLSRQVFVLVPISGAL